MMKCDHRIIILFLMLGFASITIAGWALSLKIVDNSLYIPYVVPLTICMVLSGAVMIRDAIVLQGGANPFFCGGKQAFINFIRRKPSPPKTIYVEGPYGVTRHPVYSASITIYFGLGLTLPWILFSFWILLLWIYGATIVEEYHLKWNRDYRKYMTRTPRLSVIGVLLYGCKKIVPGRT